MDHWLPLFEERLATLFDHIDPATPVLRGHRTDATAETRFEAIRDYHANRVAAEQEQAGSYRPLAPEALFLTEAEWTGAAAARPIHVVSPFDVPPSTRSEEHPSELQSLMRNSYAVFHLTDKNTLNNLLNN